MSAFRKFLRACGVVLGIAITMLQPASAWAADISLVKAPIALSYPNQWSARNENGVLRLDDPARDVMMVFDVVRASEVDRALGNLESRLRTFGVGRVSVTGDEERRINGMRAALKSGKAIMNDQFAVQLGVAIIEVSEQDAVIVFSVVKDAAAARHKETVLKIIESIRRR